MRKGKILGVNALEGRGFIQDENDQIIAFCLESLDRRLQIHDSVLFEIALTRYGLTAINLKPPIKYLMTLSNGDKIICVSGSPKINKSSALAFRN
ncbi:hypothetical protein [Pedobacter mucosus]|uniref:hypothetical protein n=1 Tax=Pedobacter mucosus TaxID=2895286 RepID=UPI001EE46F22|nr:hypothetical protein [Pedobacter mucosus]UKT63602.1 hypothetical protein LOK61_17760 [Pedobacter mucosus]